MKADFKKYMDKNGYDYHSFDRCEDMDNLINQFAEDFAEQENDICFWKGYKLGYRDCKRGNSNKFKQK